MDLSTKKNEIVTDPVCGMAIAANKNEISALIDGETYYFCAENCRKSFVNNPHKFLCREPAKKKGIWGRYLARLQKASGGKPMKCH